MSDRVERLALAAILAVAVWLRVRGIAFGLPAIYNQDEIAIMSRALAFAKGDLNPHNFLYPTLYFYALFAWEAAYFACGHVLGAIPSREAFQQSFFLDPSGIFLAGRGLSVACGTATVAAVWGLGRALAGRAAGLAAALFLAVAPFAVQDAHYVKHDVPVTLLIVLAMLAAAPLLLGERTERRRRQLAWSAALAGLAASTHYYAVFAGLPVACAVWAGWSDSPVPTRIRRVVESGVIAAVAFLLGSPFLLVEPLTALRDVRANRQIVVDRAVEGGGRLFASASEYARMLWHDALGWPVVILALVGLLVLCRLRMRVVLAFAAFPIAFLLFISNTVAATRYLNPVLPFAAVLAGIGLVALAGWARRVEARTPVAIGLAVVAALPGATASWRLGGFFRQTDTRTLALDYIRSHVPDGDGVLVQPYSVPVPESRASVIEALTAHLGDVQRASMKFQLRLRLPSWPTPAYRVVYLGHGGLDPDKQYVDYPDLGGPAGLAALRTRNVHYVVLKRYNDESDAVAPLVEVLTREARRVAEVSPYRTAADGSAVRPFLHNTDARIDARLARPGPVVEIWQLQ